MHHLRVTHPDFASLVDPLFAMRKEGLENAFCIPLFLCSREGRARSVAR